MLRLGDVATVRIGSLTRYGAVTKDGEGEAVQGLVLSLRGADASAIVSQVRVRLEDLKTSLPPGVTLNVFYDRSDLIGKAVGTVSKALMEATVLVVVLLLAFLGNLRAAIVVAVTLPFAALVTFSMMKAFGMSANLMSLGGLAIAIGLDRRCCRRRGREHGRACCTTQDTTDNVPLLHQVYRAASEVAVPVASGIFIICLVFLPLLSLQGLEGKLFAPVALTIIFALSGSLVISLTLIPVLSSYVLREGAHGEPLLMRILVRGYKALLEALPRLSLARVCGVRSGNCSCGGGLRCGRQVVHAHHGRGIGHPADHEVAVDQLEGEYRGRPRSSSVFSRTRCRRSNASSPA